MDCRGMNCRVKWIACWVKWIIEECVAEEWMYSKRNCRQMNYRGTDCRVKWITDEWIAIQRNGLQDKMNCR